MWVLKNINRDMQEIERLQKIVDSNNRLRRKINKYVDEGYLTKSEALDLYIAKRRIVK